MKYGMKDFWYGMEMEWKKISSIEYGKTVFHSIPYHALSPMKERDQNKVKIQKFDGKAVRALIDFMYGGKIVINHKNVINL